MWLVPRSKTVSEIVTFDRVKTKSHANNEVSVAARLPPRLCLCRCSDEMKDFMTICLQLVLLRYATFVTSGVISYLFRRFSSGLVHALSFIYLCLFSWWIRRIHWNWLVSDTSVQCELVSAFYFSLEFSQWMKTSRWCGAIKCRQRTFPLFHFNSIQRLEATKPDGTTDSKQTPNGCRRRQKKS